MLCLNTDLKCIPTFIPIQIVTFSKEAFMWITHYITWNLLLYLIDGIWSMTVVLNEIQSYTACFRDISLLYAGPKAISNL